MIELTAEQEARVQEAASGSGRDVRDVLTEAALWLVKFHQGHAERLERSIAQAERGKFLAEN